VKSKKIIGIMVKNTGQKFVEIKMSPLNLKILAIKCYWLHQSISFLQKMKDFLGNKEI